MFSSAKSLYNDYESPYHTLVVISGKVNMKVSRLRSLCAELYKSINSINSSFMNETFRLRVTNRVVCCQYRFNQVSFSNKRIRYFAPKIWNSLPPRIKSCKNLETFKRVIESWNGITCNCGACKNYPSKMFQKHTEAVLI